MPSSSESKKMRDLNELFEDVAASSPDIEYVDSYDLLSTKGGDFNASLRSGDGVHYTDDGRQDRRQGRLEGHQAGLGRQVGPPACRVGRRRNVLLFPAVRVEGR